jgi:ZIP family zinc transporter
MEKWMEAGIWGLISGGALVIGAVLGYFLNISQKTIAIIMAFGAGYRLFNRLYPFEAFRASGISCSAKPFLHHSACIKKTRKTNNGTTIQTMP